jgi:hypothetical protein
MFFSVHPRFGIKLTCKQFGVILIQSRDRMGLHSADSVRDFWPENFGIIVEEVDVLVS